MSETCCQVNITHYAAQLYSTLQCPSETPSVQCTALGAYITVLYKLPGSVRSAHWHGDTTCYKMSLYKVETTTTRSV